MRPPRGQGGDDKDGDGVPDRPSGGSNNSGLGGATMRFSPEKDDKQNAGLVQAAALLSAAVKEKHPRLSNADLWVLAAYAAVEALGGPAIPFVGGRFDARDGSRAPCGDAPAIKVPPSHPSYQAPQKHAVGTFCCPAGPIFSRTHTHAHAHAHARTHTHTRTRL